jgi:hypothetical protein
MIIENTKITNVKMNPNNPRVIKDDKFKKLVKSIKDFPEMLEVRPIVVDDDMVVLGGNMRLKACLEAGLKEVAIIKFENLSEDKKKEFIVKDNVGYGEWDWDIINNEWEVEELEEWGLDVIEMDVDVDYSALGSSEDDEEFNKNLEEMKNGLRKAIQIEYEQQHYEEASELVKYWREKGLYIGMFLMEKLKEEKSKEEKLKE